MFCTNCGANLPEGTTVCPQCGAIVEGAATPAVEQPVYQAPAQPQYQQPVYQAPQYNAYQPKATADPDQSASAKSVLIFGILGLAFADTFILSFLGIIFSAIGLKKATQYGYDYGLLTGRAKVGRILAKVGLILGIVLTVFFVIYLIAIIAAISQGSSYRGYSYYY